MNGNRAVRASLAADVRNPEKLASSDLEVLASVAYEVRALNDAVTHEPFGNPAGPGLWHHKGMQLPAYIQQVAHGIMKSGELNESRAISAAVGRCKAWCAGEGGVTAATKAKACLAVAEWEKLKGEAHVTKGSVWNPSQHPRVPKGQPGGGEFGPGGKGPAPTNAKPVGPGSSGPQVKALQERLNKLGFNVKVDGQFGPQMSAAVKKFQSQHKDAHGKPLKVDGLVGPLTTSALRMKLPVRKTPAHSHVKKKTAPAPARVSKAAAPELVTLPGVELLAAGTWELSSGRNTFTRDDIQAAIEASHCPAVGNAVIKLGHIDPRFDGEPAIGHVTNLRADESGNKLIGDLANMPGWFGQIAHAAYPKRSVEGAYGFTCQIGHDHPFVLTGLAMLGVTAPGVGTLNTLPDIADLYGMNAAAAAELTGWEFTSDNLDDGGEPVPVTEEDVRRAYYANSGAPNDWWITELQMAPTQLVVSSGDGKIYRVPFTIDGDEIQFEASQEVPDYTALAASRSGHVVTYASAEESRSVEFSYDPPDEVDAASGDNNGWVLRNGKWVYDPDNDGDDDSSPQGDTDNSHFDADGNPKDPNFKLPPKPKAPAAADGKTPTKPYGDVEYADPGYLDADGNQASKSGKPGVKRYPLSADKVEAAWSYINQEANASQYTPDQLAAIKGKVKAAMKKHGHQVSEDTKAAASDPPTMSGDDKSGNMNNASMTSHGAFTGTHSHPHAANGSQGSDEMHTHSHTHSGDGNHGHTHAAGAKTEGSLDVDFTAEQEANLRTLLGMAEGDEFEPTAIEAAAKALSERKVAAGKRFQPAPGTIVIEQEVWDNTLRKVEASERFRAKVLRNERDEVIDKAVRDGKFSAARKTHWARLWDADPEGTREVIAGLTRNVVPVDDIGAGGGNLDDEAYEQEFAALYPPGTFGKGR